MDDHDIDKTRIAVEIFDRLAEAYQQKFMDVSAYGPTFDRFCSLIVAQDAEVLEIACGPGNITRYLLSKRPNFRVFGIDLAPNMVQLARQNNPTAEFAVMDGRHISLLSRQFAAIMCGFCLPYLSREEAMQLIADCSRRLIPGGVLYLSTMEDDHNKSGWHTGSQGDKMYLHYHEAKYLTATLEAHGFEVLEVHRQGYAAQDGTTFTDLVVMGKWNGG